LRTEYNGWLLAQDPNLQIPATTCRDVSDWIIAAEKNVTDETLKNAWRKTGYSYFGEFTPNGKFEGDDAMVGDDPEDECNPGEQDPNESFDSESTLPDYTNAELGLPDSSSSDDSDDNAAGNNDEGMV
jgi:hypothetical protein